jgi:hypothetical protein
MGMMRMNRRAMLHAVRLCILLSMASLAPVHGEQLGIVPLTASDLAKVERAQCEATVATLPRRPGEQPRDLMRIANGSTAWARFAALPGAVGRRDLVEWLITLIRSGREKTGFGRFQVTYGGSVPSTVDPAWFETYQLTLNLKADGHCAPRPEAACTRYNGTLDVRYRFRGLDKDLPTLAAPTLQVQMFEWCSTDNYRYYGMFAFPTLLDKLGGLLLRSR